MNVLNGSEQYEMRAEDFGMESAQSDKIVLPYLGMLWGDFLLDIMNAVSRKMTLPHDALYGQLVKQVSAGFSFNVQPAQIRIIAYVDVFPFDGTSFRDRVFVQASNDEIASVLDRFFQCGCCGLDDDYSTYYHEKYMAWREAKKIKLI